MFSSALVPIVSAGAVAFFEGGGGGTPTVVQAILDALMAVLNTMGDSIIGIIKQGLQTFAPILMTMSVVWLAINLYQRFTARAGR